MGHSCPFDQNFRRVSGLPAIRSQQLRRNSDSVACFCFAEGIDGAIERNQRRANAAIRYILVHPIIPLFMAIRSLLLRCL